MLERFDQLAIERAFDPEELVEGLAEAFIALSREKSSLPRASRSRPNVDTLSMPLYRVGGPIMVKSSTCSTKTSIAGSPHITH